MNLGLRNMVSINATMVSNDFIDTYMTAANGEYIKVYLYLLRHENEELTVSAIADALNHTEADVKRALSYWKETGVLAGEEAGKAEGTAIAEAAAAVQIPEPGNSYERMEKLSEDAEFKSLLYVVQQYLGKTFTQIECEKFGYLYDGLGMTCDLLEYLVEYCAGGNHTSIHYIEKVALNWYQQGIHTREEAREYTQFFSKDVFSVMKAFGISNRNPGPEELKYIKKWFQDYGFDQNIIAAACNRTLIATGSVSFPYTESILSKWKEQNVRTLADVEALDKRHQLTKTKQEKLQGSTAGRKSNASGNNRFKNFEERSYDYEDMVWEGMRRRQKGGSLDGTQ